MNQLRSLSNLIHSWTIIVKYKRKCYSSTLQKKNHQLNSPIEMFSSQLQNTFPFFFAGTADLVGLRFTLHNLYNQVLCLLDFFYWTSFFFSCAALRAFVSCTFGWTVYLPLHGFSLTTPVDEFSLSSSCVPRQSSPLSNTQFQIIRQFDFFIPSLITRLIQKISANIVKFKSFLRTFINKPNHDTRNDILHKFLNKTSCQTWYLKSQMSYNLAWIE